MRAGSRGILPARPVSIFRPFALPCGAMTSGPKTSRSKTSRPKQAEARPAPRLYLLTPPVADAVAFSTQLAAALAAGDVAAVLLRLAEADERTQINRAKA